MAQAWDYSKALGANADQAHDPWKGKIPTESREYAAFRQYHETQMLELMGGQGVLTLSATCEGKDAQGRPKRLDFPKPGHFGGGIAMSCDHVLHQDPVHPEGIWFVPLVRKTATGYWLCKACWNSLQNCRLNLDMIRGKCAQCVVDAVEAVQREHPGAIHDLTQE